MRFSSRSSALFRAVYILASTSSASTAAIPTNATVSAQGSVVTDAAGVRYLAPGLKVPLSSANVLRRDDKRDVNSNQQIANGDGNVQINNQVINGGAVSALTSLPGSCVLRSRVITVTATNGVVIDDPTYAVSAIPTTITTTNSLGALVTITTTIDPAQSSSSGAAQYLATSTGPSTFATLTATNTSITTTTATSVLGSSSSDPAAATSAAATSGTSTVPTSSTTTSTAAAATSTCPTAEADGTEVDLSSVSYPMVDQAAFVQAMLEQHNAYRQRNQVGAVTWNSTLAAAALVRSSSGVFEHTANNPYGENLAMGGYSNPLYYGFLWYNESLQYDYSNPGFSEATGHFTQMVWEGSLEIGCAYVNNNTIEGYPYYLTCEYSPPGNYLGEFAENVFEPNCIPFPAQPAGDIPGED